MTRRLGLASLLVVVFAFSGAAAGPARPLQTLRLVVSVAWLYEAKQAEHELRPVAPRAPIAPAVATAPAPLSAGFRQVAVERSLYQRPPPFAI